MLSPLLLFSLGVCLLLISTGVFVKSAVSLSSAVRISPLIIGITLVALGTSLPELVVSLIAILRHDTGLALGNLVGSNIINILLVFAAGIFFGRIRIGTAKTQTNIAILLTATFLFVLLQTIRFPRPLTGLALIGTSLFITLIEYRLGRAGRQHEDRKIFYHRSVATFSYLSVMYLLLTLIGIACGGLMVVNSVETLSRLTGYSTTVLGLTLTAVATSLPELLATLLSQKEHQEKMTVGNIIGSNIYNLLFIGGLISFFPASFQIPAFNWVWLSGTTIGFTLLLHAFKGKQLPKQIGFVLLLAFLVYVILLTIN